MKKLLVILVCFFTLCTLASCKNQIEYIKINEETIPATFEVDNVEQRLTAIVLEVGKSKGENEYVYVSKSMISESDLNKLKNKAESSNLNFLLFSLYGFNHDCNTIRNDVDARLWRIYHGFCYLHCLGK